MGPPLGPPEGERLREAARRYLEAVEEESPFVIRRGIELAELALELTPHVSGAVTDESGSAK